MGLGGGSISMLIVGDWVGAQAALQGCHRDGAGGWQRWTNLAGGGFLFAGHPTPLEGEADGAAIAAVPATVNLATPAAAVAQTVNRRWIRARFLYVLIGTPSGSSVSLTARAVACVTHDTFETLGQLNVANRVQRIHADVELDRRENEMQPISVDVESRISAGIGRLFVWHDGSDHRARRCSPG
jgi:hypothetical protein